MKLHLAVNSGFIQIFANISEQIDNINEHQFVIYGEQMTGQVINRENIKKNFTILKSLTSDNNTINHWVEKSSTIYIHFLSNEVIEFLSKFDIDKKKIVWFLWGSDAFSLPEVYNKMQQFRVDHFRAILGNIRTVFTEKKSSITKLNFLRKINYVAHYSIDDFYLIKPLLKANTEFKYFTYGVLEAFIDDTYSLCGKNILLGNSASKNNNHIYTIKKILPKNVNHNIICPLPYGSDSEYTENVIKEGIKKFGKRFVPFTSLIETKKYNKEILGNCEFAFLPHNRSQAWGNVMQLLWQGSKVFMFPCNNLYKFLKQKELQVFSLNKHSYKKLHTAQVSVEYNKTKLLQHFSLNNLSNYYKEILFI